MGSLMAGWSTSPSGAEEVLKRSNSSLTKEELNKYWKSKRFSIQQHLEEANKDAAMSPKMRTSRTSSISSDNDDKFADLVGSPSTPVLSLKSDWWTKSTWAFLNEPPIVEEKNQRYTAQFDVAAKTLTEHNPGPNRSLSAFY